MPPEFWDFPSFMSPGMQLARFNATNELSYTLPVWREFCFLLFFAELALSFNLDQGLLVLILVCAITFIAAQMFCYCRLTYMPMSYLYGKKFVGPITPLIKQIREEIYNEPYDQISWWRIRHLCAAVSSIDHLFCQMIKLWCNRTGVLKGFRCLFQEDAHYPHTKLQTLMWDTLYFGTEPLLNRWPFKKIRDIAIKKTMEHIHYEDENSRYITIGCVEKVMPVPRIKELNGFW